MRRRWRWRRWRRSVFFSFERGGDDGDEGACLLNFFLCEGSGNFVVDVDVVVAIEVAKMTICDINFIYFKRHLKF